MSKAEETEKDDDRGLTEEDDDSTTVLLPQDKQLPPPPTSSSSTYMLIPCYKHVQDFLKTYRSNDPQSRITPFAVILLAVISVVYVLNQADRLVLAVLIPSGLQCIDNNASNTSADVCVTEDHDSQLLNVSDCISFDNAQQGLLTGPAFTVIYVVAGLPLAWLADTKSRPLVFLGGIAFWSTMIILMGFIHNFWELLLLRIMLGVGEASYNPVAYSLIADFFPPKNRAVMMSIYHYGVYLGGGFGWMTGAINSVLNWRWTFRLLGIIGVCFIPLGALALYEPKTTRERRLERVKGNRVYSLWEVFKYLVTCPPYLMLLVAGSIRNIPGYALGGWLPTFYARAFGLTSSEYGIKVGLVVIFGGALGCFLGGVLSDWLSRYRRGAKAFVIAVSQLLAAPSIFGVLMAPTPTSSFGILFIAYVTAETWLGPAAAIVQDICMPPMRAQASAIYIGVITLVASVGPLIVPAFLDHVPALSDCDGIRYALIFTVPTLYVVSSVLFAMLGIVMQWWIRRQRKKDQSYYRFTDEAQIDRATTTTTTTTTTIPSSSPTDSSSETISNGRSNIRT